MKFIPLDYQILPNLGSTSKTPAVHQPRDIPGRVITLLHASSLARLKNEAFPALKHQEGFFFEDKNHDWNLSPSGHFRYFSRAIGSQARTDHRTDAIAVYQWMEVQTIKLASGEAVDGDTVLRGIVQGFDYQISVKNAHQPGSEPLWVLACAPSDLPEGQKDITGKLFNREAAEDSFRALLLHAQAVLNSRIASTETSGSSDTDTVDADMAAIGAP